MGNPALLPNLLNSAQALAHTMDQPYVIEGVWKRIEPLGLAGMAALTACDTLKAPAGQERKNVLLQDVLVLWATALGTRAAVKRLMLPELPELKVAAHEVEALGKRYGQGLADLLNKKHKGMGDFRQILQTVQQKTGLTLAEKRADLVRALPVPEGEGFVESLKDMGAFFGVGLTSVVSGLAGGVLANRLTGVPPGSTASMAKEGIFQFVANIALCAVGASAGLLAIEKLGLKNRLVRTGVITGGLMVGILGGGKLANWVGKRWVNPLCDRLEAGSQPVNPPGLQNSNQSGLPASERKVGFSDAILHLDDAPTALALAGMEVIKPLIPLFFLFSGYRTGTAARNKAGVASAFQQKPFTASAGMLPSPITQLFGSTVTGDAQKPAFAFQQFN